MSKRQSSNGGGKRRSSGAGEESEAQKHSEHPFEKRLRAVVKTVDVVNTLSAPLLLSIRNLLSVAAGSFNCDEASVIVRDDEDGSLKFLCAIGEVAEQLMQVKIPQGRGIAGFVFECGQPLAVADASRESSFYADIDKATGYSTQTLLATPLTVEGRTIGVLEFVNRLGGPPFQPYTSDEMDRAALFATAIAPLVAAHERTGLIESLFAQAMRQALNDEEHEGQAGEREQRTQWQPERPEQTAQAKQAEQAAAQVGQRGPLDLREWLDGVRAAPEHKDLLLLAVLLRDVAATGDAERRLCRGLLENLATFIKQASSGNGDHAFLS